MVDSYDVELLHCDWCGKLMTYDESARSEIVYTGANGGTVHLCYVDKWFVDADNLATDDQLAADKLFRDTTFHVYIAYAINPELSENWNYPWY
jgi:hypothetical protein